MTFNEILEKLTYGRKVRRGIWPENLWLESNGDTCFLRTANEDNTLKVYANGDRVFTLDDVTAHDWEFYKG